MPTSSDPSTPESIASLKSFSCVLCAQRKVKCDKAPGGCFNCAKARIECIYKAPPPPRRRKRGTREIDVQSRLRLYESALRKVGVDPEVLVKQELLGSTKKAATGGAIGIDNVKGLVEPGAPSSTQSPESGVLVSGTGKSRYLENSIWTSIQSEFRNPDELLEESSTDEDDDGFLDASSPHDLPVDGMGLLLGTPGSASSSFSLRPLHPEPGKVFKLWQVYLDNINPLVKVFHTPTVQQIISHACGDLENIPKNVEALLFSIYCVAAESLDAAGCAAIMGESRTVITQRFKTAAQYALINAGFLKTIDLMVLQALVLFLTALESQDARVLWVLTGVSRRIGQRIGLHHDPETLNLPPFESEIRRRLWWQILMQDGFVGKAAGVAGSGLIGNVNRPANVNDSDLFPGMKERPKEHDGATEMMFFLIRCHAGQMLVGSTNTDSNFDGAWNKLSSNAATIATKEKAISELEALYQRRFLQYCDSSITWHYLCSLIAKAVINMLRFTANNTEHHGASKCEPTQAQKDTLFRYAANITESQNLAYTTKEMKGYRWHVNSHFPWKTFIYFVSELRARTRGPQVDDAWKQVALVFECYPHFANDAAKRALPLALGTLTLKAWDAYAAANDTPESQDPHFIHTLRARNTKRSPPSAAAPATQPPSTSYQDTALDPAVLQRPPQPDLLDGSLSWNADLANSLESPSLLMPDFPLLDPEQMDWANWDSLLSDFQMQGVGAATDVLAQGG